MTLFLFSEFIYSAHLLYIKKLSTYFSRSVADRKGTIRSYHNNGKYSHLFHENFPNMTLSARSHSVKYQNFT